MNIQESKSAGNVNIKKKKVQGKGKAMNRKHDNVYGGCVEFGGSDMKGERSLLNQAFSARVEKIRISWGCSVFWKRALKIMILYFQYRKLLFIFTTQTLVSPDLQSLLG